ncbi:MAG: hypothetical protein MJK10_09530 [Pseudomonadales bacterium]|nr:hypothetical protein [Pseudomonadales bacterium]NRA16284.1 hypothetical protein [Oceanospirillaceae bacterium]
MQNLSSLQSNVRTDFTLKYYALDEKLASAQLLKIHGHETQLFIRSWLEYAEAGGDCIISWSEGDFAALLGKMSDKFQSSIDSTEALLRLLKEQTAGRKAIFVVDAEQISSSQLSLLLKTLGNNDPQQAETATDYHAKIVLYFKGEEIGSYRDLLIDFKHSLQIGSVSQVVAAKKRSLATVLLSTLLAAIVLTGVSYWQVQKDSDSEFSLWIVDVTGWDFDLGALEWNSSSADSNDNLAATDIFAQSEPADKLEGSSSQKPAIGPLSTADAAAESASIAALEGSKEADSAVSQDTPNSTEKNSMPAELAVIASSSDKPASQLAANPENPAVQAKTDSSGKVVLVSALTANTSSSEQPGSGFVSAELIPAAQTQEPQAELVAPKAAIANAVEQPAANANSTVSENLDASDDAITEQLQLLIDDWIAAWQQQDFKKYSAFYGSKFTVGNKLSHRDWLKWRKQRIEKPKWIKLSRSKISFSRPLDAEQLSISFTLNYESPNYQDVTLKKLTLKPVGDSFQIIVEENLTVTRVR